MKCQCLFSEKNKNINLAYVEFAERVVKVKRGSLSGSQLYQPAESLSEILSISWV